MRAIWESGRAARAHEVHRRRIEARCGRPIAQPPIAAPPASTAATSQGLRPPGARAGAARGRLTPAGGPEGVATGVPRLSSRKSAGASRGPGEVEQAVDACPPWRRTSRRRAARPSSQLSSMKRSTDAWVISGVIHVVHAAPTARPPGTAGGCPGPQRPLTGPVPATPPSCGVVPLTPHAPVPLSRSAVGSNDALPHRRHLVVVPAVGIVVQDDHRGVAPLRRLLAGS